MQTYAFQSGNSQAVRIPADFRFDVDVVDIFRAENGDNGKIGHCKLINQGIMVLSLSLKHST